MLINFNQNISSAVKDLTLKEIELSLIDSAQLLSNGINLASPIDRQGLVGPMPIYFSTHPYTKWVLSSLDNYFWTADYFLELCRRYKTLKREENGGREENHKLAIYSKVFLCYLEQNSYVMAPSVPVILPKPNLTR